MEKNSLREFLGDVKRYLLNNHEKNLRFFCSPELLKKFPEQSERATLKLEGAKAKQAAFSVSSSSSLIASEKKQSAAEIKPFVQASTKSLLQETAQNTSLFASNKENVSSLALPQVEQKKEVPSTSAQQLNTAKKTVQISKSPTLQMPAKEKSQDPMFLTKRLDLVSPPALVLPNLQGWKKLVESLAPSVKYVEVIPESLQMNLWQIPNNVELLLFVEKQGMTKEVIRLLSSLKFACNLLLGKTGIAPLKELGSWQSKQKESIVFVSLPNLEQLLKEPLRKADLWKHLMQMLAK